MHMMNKFIIHADSKPAAAARTPRTRAVAPTIDDAIKIQ